MPAGGAGAAAAPCKSTVPSTPYLDKNEQLRLNWKAAFALYSGASGV
jgi:hypothetical protein